MKPVLVVFAVSALMPSVLFAEGSFWTDREVCRAATKVYFFLDSKPVDAPNVGDHLGFRSSAGNVYTCQIEGAIASFYWVNKSGEDMTSNSTSFLVNENLLHVKTDMLEEDFPPE